MGLVVCILDHELYYEVAWCNGFTACITGWVILEYSIWQKALHPPNWESWMSVTAVTSLTYLSWWLHKGIQYDFTHSQISLCFVKILSRSSFCCVLCAQGCVNCTISTWVIVTVWLIWVWSGWVEALSALLISAVATSRIRYCYLPSQIPGKKKDNRPCWLVCYSFFVFSGPGSSWRNSLEEVKCCPVCLYHRYWHGGTHLARISTCGQMWHFYRTVNSLLWA